MLRPSPFAVVRPATVISLALLVGLAPSLARAQETDPITQRTGETVVQGGAPIVEERPVTPVVPLPSRPPERAYQLYWELDVPALVVAGALSIGRSIRSHRTAEPAYCIQTARVTEPDNPVCDTEGLFFFDVWAAGSWDENWALVSDVVAVVIGVAPVALLVPDGGFLNMLNDAVVIYQAALFATTLSGISTTGTARARPFAYGDEAPLDDRLGGDSALSFFSGHSAFTFAVATATFWTIARRHPRGAYKWIVLGVGLALASLTATARVLAGKHFPSDVATGAAVGASVGTLIPTLHGTPVQVAGDLGSGRASIGATVAF